MTNTKLTTLMSELARLLHDRSSTPRDEALGTAHRLIRDYARPHGLSETWCDNVLLTFLGGRHDVLAA